MKIAWKEIKKSKARFMILGSIIFLVRFLTFIISGLANGLSQDNAALIKDMPDGQFYMADDADETYNLSEIDENVQDKVIEEHKDAAALTIQMCLVNDAEEKQHSVAFVDATDSELYENVGEREIILDRTLEDKWIKVGDTLTNNQYSHGFTVQGFVEEKKFRHAPVAYINMN